MVHDLCDSVSLVVAGLFEHGLGHVFSAYLPLLSLHPPLHFPSPLYTSLLFSFLPSQVPVDTFTSAPLTARSPGLTRTPRSPLLAHYSSP